MKIIGLDVGEKRIGVARADSQTRIAIPVGYIVVDGSEWQKIAKMAQIHGTNWFVLGLPRSNEGNETKQSEYVRHFAEILKKQIPGARIRFQDESLTSVMAEERLKGRRKPYEKGDIDAEAAAIILQDFMEQFQGTMAARVAPSTRPSITVETNPAPLDKKPLDNEKPSPSRKKWAFRIGRTQLCTAVLAGGCRNPNQLRAVLAGPGNILGSFVKAQPVEGLLAGVKEYSHVRNRAEDTGKHMVCILFISALDGNVDMLPAAGLVCQGFG